MRSRGRVTHDGDHGLPGDHNIPAHRSNSTFGALIGDLPNGAPSASVTLRPNGGNGSWGFSVVYPQDPDD
ncbi:MAG TPA: hypothetical protein VFU13_00600 [Steroidobacteraceae bacterium]|nr:hypothetical protein [Steroidobacteraceae bacterium]